VDIDHWLDDPDLRTHHRREAPAPPEALWAAAESVRVRDCRVLGRLIPMRVPGVRSQATFGELFREPPFTPLEEGPDFLLSGLCGRIWTIRGGFDPLDAPEDFLSWSVPGTARVLFAHWVEPTDRGSALVSEARVDAVDRRAARYLRALEPFVATFQGFIAIEPLRIAVQRVRAGR
jgi:hypothetical protein